MSKTGARLDNPDFVREIRAPELLPWSQALFTANGTEYRYSGGWIFPVSEGERIAARAWAKNNRFSDLNLLKDLTWIPGPEQWFEDGTNRAETLASNERFHERARTAFGLGLQAEPLHDPWFNSTVVGACLEKSTGITRLAVIQFSPPPPTIQEIHHISDFEFFASPFAVTFEEWRRQKQLAYQTPEGVDVINLREEDGASFSRIRAPFYTWPKEGPIPMLSPVEAKGRNEIASSYEYAEVILFFAWF
ncbi:MAG: hypothetical protein KGP28_06560 [Bdellovibrionales bacterium]|nr:hypothetical protein [Bdellovibrionales bacterium]